MEEKIFRDSRWFYDMSKNAWCLTKAGYCSIGDFVDIKTEIEGSEVRSFIVALDEEGWIKPRLDERLRAEDLKITHRALDIISELVKNKV